LIISTLVADLSVIVCAYTQNRWDAMIAAVGSLRAQMLAPLEIILVIDHNHDLYLRAIEEIHGIIILENQALRGLSGARNTGIAHAKGAILAFMDEDAAAEPDWIEKIMPQFRDPVVLGVGGAICPVWLGPRPGWLPEEFYWTVGCTYKGLPETPAPVRNLIGCNMAFRREVFDKVGGFRSGMGRIGTLPLGCEETELCIRAARQIQPGVFFYLPDTRVWHRVPENRGQWSYFIHRCYSEGRSKAQVAHFVGAQRGLASERSYTYRTLPRGFLRGLRDFLRHGRVSGLGQMVAILTGLAVTSAGYLIGNVIDAMSTPADKEGEFAGEV
jgi:glucosyl-dolichyl phosphate glucuronosyltransferase